MSDRDQDRLPELGTPESEKLEAAAFRRLVGHLRERTDVQNIDMMNLAGFCRNCLSRWYGEEAERAGISLTKDEARAVIYGMPYEEWRAKYQTEASAGQKEGFEAAARGERSVIARSRFHP